MNVTILYFASLREGLGTAREQAVLPPEVHTIGALRTWLCARGGVWTQLLADDRAVRMAVNQQMTGPDAALADGAEVAFFPPVTGG